MGTKTPYIVMLSFMIFLMLNCNKEPLMAGNTMDNSKQYKIKIMIGDNSLTATLDDSPTTRDFIALLPLDLTLEDYAGMEKISYLPKKLSKDDSPAGCDPSVGDITYYAPWDNLAIFYNDFGYANGLIKLGKIYQKADDTLRFWECVHNASSRKSVSILR